MNDPILCLVGPTASGKTEVGILLAEILGGEILSADARQFYRKLTIGTAKPTEAERARAPHHLIDIVDPEDAYDAGRFARDAARIVADVRSRGRLPIVVGGTGLYVRALVRGLDVGVGRSPEVRLRIQGRLEREGSAALHDELASVDPESAASIHPNDEVRIIRALEIYETTGETRAAHFRKGAARGLDHLLAGLDRPRPDLFRRIDERFDRMMEEGFLDEVRALLGEGLDPELPSLRSPGYRELLQHLRGELPLADAVDRAKRETRRFAKRQLTWFRSETVRWEDPGGEGGCRGAAERIAAWFEEVRRTGEP